jgi:hypothetical protein
MAQPQSILEPGLDVEPLLALNLAVSTPMPSPEWLEDGGLARLVEATSGGRLDTGLTGEGAALYKYQVT